MRKNLDWTAQFVRRDGKGDTFEQAAHTLRAFLDQVSEWTTLVYGSPVYWRTYERDDRDRWETVDGIVTELFECQRRDDNGEVWEGLGSGGVVLAMLDDLPLLFLRWRLRGDTVPVQFFLEFQVSQGKIARPLTEHTQAQLTDLLHRGIAITRANRARIYDDDTGDILAEALTDHDNYTALGIASYIPKGIKLPNDLPETLTTHPIDDGTIAINDLQQATDNPESVVPGVLALDHALHHGWWT